MEEMLMKKETNQNTDIDNDDSLEKELRELMAETEQSRLFADKILFGNENDSEENTVTEQTPEVAVADVEQAQPEEGLENTVMEEMAAPEEKVEDTVAEEMAAPDQKAEDKISFFKTEKWDKIWDTATTVLLIGVMSTPVLILGYIIWWFLSK